MLPTADMFWPSYRSLVKQLLRPLGKDDGFSEKSIDAAEQRLERKLPLLLREFYRIAGGRHDINGIFQRLLSPESLRIDGDVLVFYEENQGACFWGIGLDDLTMEDPAVMRLDSFPSSTWEPEFAHLSEFLTGMLFVQAVNGGMRHHGIGSADATNIAEASSDWETVRVGGSWNNTVLMRDGQVLYVFGTGTAPEVFGGAKTKRKFLELERAFGVSWDYCTLEDE